MIAPDTLARMQANIRAETLAGLRAREGDLWREVQGEWHAEAGEMPTWILLYEDSDLAACHAAFADVIRPHVPVIRPCQFTVSYTILTGPLEVTLDSFMDSDEILSAVGSRDLGAYPDTANRDAHGVFHAAASGLRPQQP